MIAAPPLFDGGFHDRLTWVGDAATAVILVGALGMFDDDEVVEDSADALPVPIELIAETR